MAVDDEADICTLTKRFLEMSELMEVDTVCSVREAMAELAEKHYDVIVSDYQMPEEDGIQFLKSLRAVDNAIPFILFTGKGREEVVIEALNNGADSYLQKGGKSVPQYAELEHRIHVVVQRHRGEEALRESEKRYRTILNQAADGILIHDKIGQIIDVNRKSCQSLGYTREELLSKNIEDIDPTANQERNSELWKATLAGESYTFESHQIRKDGNSIPVEVTLGSVHLLDGSAILGIVRDITERKRAEEELRKNEKKYCLITNNIADVVSVMGMDRRFTYVSPSIKSLRGFTPEEAVEQSLDQVFTPESMRIVLSTMSEEMELESSGNADPDRTRLLELEEYRKDGSTIWVSNNISFMHDENGQPMGIIAVSRDITERKQAEEALQASKRALADIIDFLPDATAVIDSEGKVVAWNQAIEKMTGVSKEEMVGQGDHAYSIPFYGTRRSTLSDLLILDDEELKKKYDYVTRIGKSLYTEGFCSALNEGKGAHVWATATSITDDKGNRVGAIESIRDITEHKRVEEALRESVQRYELVMDGSSAGLWDSDVVNKRIHFSSHWKAMRGYTDAEIGDSKEEWSSRIHPDDAPRVIATMEAHFAGQTEVYEEEYRVRCKDGSYIWVLDRGKVVRDAAGRVIRNVGSEIDITERKRTEDALRQSEERFKQVAESAGEWIWEVDPTGLLTYCSPVVEKIMGYKPEEIVGKYHFHELMAPEIQEQMEQGVFAAFKARLPLRALINAGVRKDGRIVYLETSGVPVEDESDELIGYRGTNTDITKRKLDEDALLESERKYRLLAENVNDVIWTLNIASQRLTYVSPSVEKLNGFTVEESLQQNLKGTLHPDSYAEIMGKLPTLIERFLHGSEAGQAMRIEARLLRKDGTWMDIEVVATLLLDERGEFTEILGVSRNVTDRVKAERSLQEANRKLKIMSTITRHDINNQMTVVKGFLELCRQREKDLELARYLERISHAAANVLELIDFTKDYQELGVHAPTWASFGRQTASAFAMLHPSEVALENWTDGVEILADPLAEKVFYNLIDNSIRHGGKVTRIKLASEQVGDDMLIVYEDDGVGISAEDKKRLFEKGLGKNTGLGLFLIQEILAITGITITEKGQAGKGVRFEMLVPPGAWRYC